MTALLTQLNEVFSAVLEGVPDVAGAITGNEILVLGVGLFFGFTVVTMFTKLLRST